MEVASFFLALCLFLVFSTSSGNGFKEIKMYQGDCEEATGCTAVNYDPVHLLFHVKETEATNTTTETQTATKKNTVQDLLQKCAESRHVIYTRQTTPTYVQTAALVQPYLLLSHYEDNLFKVDFDSHMFEELHFPSWMIRCVAYWTREKRLLLCVDKEIISTPITIKKRTLVKRIGAENIFIDEEANLIFVKSSVAGGGRIYRMTVRGERLFCVVCMLGDPKFVFDIDRKRKLIYAMNALSVKTFTYNGTRSGRFDANVETFDLQAMVFDQQEDVIYFHDGSDTVYKQRNGTQIFAIFPPELLFFPLKSIVIHGKYLYISNYDGDILKLDCTKQIKEEILRIPENYTNCIYLTKYP